jgi:putative endonuclease
MTERIVSAAENVTEKNVTEDNAVKGSDWWVYLIRTRSGALYCGISNDVQKRLQAHRCGKGAKALRGKGPLELVWTQRVPCKSSALKLELAIKKLSKQKKENIVLYKQNIMIDA